MINARAETITQKPSFRSAYANRRCLILADGYYEWKKSTKGPSTPYRFTLKSHKPFAFAGLWESWRDPEGVLVKSCTIITCAANQMAAPIHDRMPVILPREKYWPWLEQKDKVELNSFLVSFPEELMVAFPVGRLVGNVQIDDPECILPVGV